MGKIQSAPQNHTPLPQAEVTVKQQLHHSMIFKDIFALLKKAGGTTTAPGNLESGTSENSEGNGRAARKRNATSVAGRRLLHHLSVNKKGTRGQRTWKHACEG